MQQSKGSSSNKCSNCQCQRVNQIVATVIIQKRAGTDYLYPKVVIVLRMKTSCLQLQHYHIISGWCFSPVLNNIAPL